MQPLVFQGQVVEGVRLMPADQDDGEQAQRWFSRMGPAPASDGCAAGEPELAGGARAGPRAAAGQRARESSNEWPPAGDAGAGSRAPKARHRTGRRRPVHGDERSPAGSLQKQIMRRARRIERIPASGLPGRRRRAVNSSQRRPRTAPMVGTDRRPTPSARWRFEACSPTASRSYHAFASVTCRGSQV